jgi:hypothetical protein
VDWYVQRDLATLCKDAPETAKQQVKFLIMRGVIDELTSRLLERAIRKRNSAEHRYISPTLADADGQLLRRTVAAIRYNHHGTTAMDFWHISGAPGAITGSCSVTVSAADYRVFSIRRALFTSGPTRQNRTEPVFVERC